MSDSLTPIDPLPVGDSLRSPTFIIACGLLIIAAGTIGAVFVFGNPEVQNVIAGTVIGTILGSVTGFYYGSSKGSQQKDATIAAQAKNPA